MYIFNLKRFSQALTLLYQRWQPLPCDCLNSAWPISVQIVGEPGFSPPPRSSVCLLDLASTSDLHMNMHCTRNTGPVTACLAPALPARQPQNKTDHYRWLQPSGPRWQGGTHALFLAHCVQSNSLFLCGDFAQSPSLSVSLPPLQWGAALFIQLWRCVPYNLHSSTPLPLPLPPPASAQRWSAAWYSQRPTSLFKWIIIRNSTVLFSSSFIGARKIWQLPT